MLGLFERFLGFIENRNVRLALAAAMIATLLVIVITVVTSVRYEVGWHLQVSTPLQFILPIIYLALFIAAWAVLHSLSAGLETDVYKDAGKRLIGQWAVSYQANIGATSPRLVGTARTASCSFSMDRLDRLELRLSTKDDPINAGVDDLVIRDVALRYNEAGGFTMFYYYCGPMRIWPNVARYIEAASDEVEIEILGRVGFDKPTGDGHVNKMKGTWYDLNGNITRLLALLNAQMVAAAREESFEPMMLSQVPMQQRSLAASMGSVDFSRE